MKTYYFNGIALTVFLLAVIVVLPGCAQRCKKSFEPKVKDDGNWTMKMSPDMMSNCTGLSNGICQFMFMIKKAAINEFKRPWMIYCKENNMSNCPQTCTLPINQTTWTTNTCTFCCPPDGTPDDCAANVIEALLKYPDLQEESTSDASISAASFNLLAASLGFFLLAKYLS